jgi:L-alanine-DL-glutamate epimerase-like enolase superfamily enzyme
MRQPNRRSLMKGGLLSIAGLSGLPSISAAVEQASTPYNRPKLRVTEDEIIDKGFIRLPERAGIGVELNEEAARKVQVPGTPRFQPAGRGQ